MPHRLSLRVSAPAEAPSGHRLRAVGLPEIRYARNGDVSIAYSVVEPADPDAAHPPDLVFVGGFVSHLEVAWEWEPARHFFERLSGFSRVVSWDKREQGLSDRLGQPPTLEQGMDVKFTGGIGVVGVYVPQDPAPQDPLYKQGEIVFDHGLFWFKGQTMGTGQCNVKAYNRQLRDLISTGRAKPSFIVSHELPLAEAANAYQHFDARDDGWTKVVLKTAA